MKGIQREIVPYAVDGLTLGADHKNRVLSEHLSDLDPHLDMSRLEPAYRLRGQDGAERGNRRPG